MNKDIPILIIGAGSIGERHIRNLWSLGYRDLTVFRQRNLPFRDIADAKVIVLTDWNTAMQSKPEIAFICTPTSQHMQQTIACLENKMHVFVEKPLSHNLDGFEELEKLLKQKKKFLQVAYMMHYHPLIKHVKQSAEELLYGKLISTTSHWGSYLPDWHPWEDYKESYAAKKSLGGGVALTLCHDVELALWLADGELTNYTTDFQFAEELGIETESIADIHFEFGNGVKSDVHLNYLDTPPIRNYKFEFEEAAIKIDYFKNSMEIQSLNLGYTSKIDAKQFERNNLYIDEVNDFFSQIDNHPDPVAYSIQQLQRSKLITKVCTS